MQDPPAGRSRRPRALLKAHRGREGSQAAGLRRPGGAFRQLEYPTPPLHATRERDEAIAAGMGKVLRKARKKRNAASGTGTQRGHAGAMLETCGWAGQGVYLPGDLVEVSSKIGAGMPVGKVQPDAHRSP